MLRIDICFCFFKQKTAYEMRISDWSSDVCSSDLTHQAVRRFHEECRTRYPAFGGSRIDPPQEMFVGRDVGSGLLSLRRRSEEHTSELQSLMRISYAVFCLKKKTTKITRTRKHNTIN